MQDALQLASQNSQPSCSPCRVAGLLVVQYVVLFSVCLFSSFRQPFVYSSCLTLAVVASEQRTRNYSYRYLALHFNNSCKTFKQLFTRTSSGLLSSWKNSSLF